MFKNSKWRLSAILNYYLAILTTNEIPLLTWSLCSNLVSIGFIWRYLWSNISQFWLKMPIRAPKIYVLGDFDTWTLPFIIETPKRHFLGGNHVRRNRYSGVVRTRCEEYKTRKLCYRKDDRAMRHIHGCPEHFRDSLTTPTATIQTVFTGFCLDRPSECSYKIWSP